MWRFGVALVCVSLCLSTEGFSASVFSDFVKGLSPAVVSNPESEQMLSKLLREGPIPPAKRVFLINGWRWHTLSVLRDLERFEILVAKERKALSSEPRLVEAHDFLWKFSWSALLKVENDVFFPWIIATIPSQIKPVIQDLKAEGQSVKVLGERLGQVCAQVYKTRNVSDLDSVGQIVTSMREKAIKMQEVHESFVVPTVAAYVSDRNQKSFNNKVLAKLGLLNSQIHLVGMRDAVKSVPKEDEVFRKQIPSIAQVMIPMWRRNFYNSMAKALE